MNVNVNYESLKKSPLKAGFSEWELLAGLLVSAILLVDAIVFIRIMF